MKTILFAISCVALPLLGATSTLQLEDKSVEHLMKPEMAERNAVSSILEELKLLSEETALELYPNVAFDDNLLSQLKEDGYNGVAEVEAHNGDYVRVHSEYCTFGKTAPPQFNQNQQCALHLMGYRILPQQWTEPGAVQTHCSENCQFEHWTCCGQRNPELYSSDHLKVLLGDTQEIDS